MNEVANLSNLTLQQLEYLVQSSDALTRAEAANRLGVTPSALTQGLGELERRVGLPLFERRGRRISLRPDGEEVLAYAQRVVADTRDLARWIESRRSGIFGSVRLGAIDAVAVYHRADAIRAFWTAHPKIDLRLTVAPSGSLLDSLIRGDLDVVVLVEPDEIPDHVRTEFLFEEELFVYAPRNAEVGNPGSWGPWVSFTPGSHTRRIVETALSRAGARFDVVAESNQPEVLREMVHLGVGWTVLPSIQAETGVDPLTPVLSIPTAFRRLVLAQRTGFSSDTTVEALVEALRHS